MEDENRQYFGKKIQSPKISKCILEKGDKSREKNHICLFTLCADPDYIEKNEVRLSIENRKMAEQNHLDGNRA
jgi:hypothetical protein